MAAALAWWGCATGPNNCELTLPDGTHVFRSLFPEDPSSGAPLFVSLWLAEAQSGSVLSSAVRLHLRGRDFVLRDLSPSDLRAAGIQIGPANGGDSDDQEAFVDFGAENELGGIEFGFSKGRLRTFFARCYVRERCDFELSWPGHDRFRLPIAEQRLLTVVEHPVSVRDYYAK